MLLKNVQTKHLDSFIRLLAAQYIFDRHALLKENHVRCNLAVFVNKNLRKAIRTSSRLLNRFRQERTISSHAAYKKHQNTCVKRHILIVFKLNTFKRKLKTSKSIS